MLDDSSGATIEIVCGRPATPTPTTQQKNANPTSPTEGVAQPEVSTKGVTATGRDVDLSGVDIGTVVKVRGGVGLFRAERQVQVERMCRSIYIYIPP